MIALITIHFDIFTILFSGNPWYILSNGEVSSLVPLFNNDLCPFRARMYISTQPGMQLLLYASHICYIGADSNLEVGAW